VVWLCACVQNDARTRSCRIIVTIMQASDTVCINTLLIWRKTARKHAGKRLVRVLGIGGFYQRQRFTYFHTNVRRIKWSESNGLWCFGSASGDDLQLWKFQLSAGTKKCNCNRDRGNKCHKRFLTEVSVNGGVVLKTYLPKNLGDWSLNLNLNLVYAYGCSRMRFRAHHRNLNEDRSIISLA